MMLLTGAAAVSYGGWLAYPPAGFIAGGLLLMTAGVMRGLAEAKAKGGRQ